MKEFKINKSFITITQLLKYFGYVGSGGEVKYFLMDNKVLLNGDEITERKKKLYDGDIVVVDDEKYKIIYDSKS